MAQGYDTEEQKECVLLVGVQLGNQEDMERIKSTCKDRRCGNGWEGNPAA